MISLIVAKADNNVIGSHNDLPWYLPADLKHFRKVTTDQTVIMGRTTFESIISRIGKPLPDRKNVVLTRNKTFSYPDVMVIHDLQYIKDLGDVFVIGGAKIYTQAILFADKLYVTEVHATVDGDTYFPAIDNLWQEVSRESHKADEKNPFDYDFVIYERHTKES